MKNLVEELQLVCEQTIAYSGDLTKGRTTHLVVAEAGGSQSSSKPAAARGWKIPVLQPAWLVDSLRAGRLLPEDDYLIPAAGSLPKETARPVSSAARAPGQTHAASAQESQLSALSRSCSSAGLADDVHESSHQPSQQQQQQQARRPGSRLRKASAPATLCQVKALRNDMIRHQETGLPSTGGRADMPLLHT